MLAQCRRDQWTFADVDLSTPPKAMSRDEEQAIVQYFTDMAGIERLAGALFDEERKKTDDPVLQQIFASFVGDEIRHATVAQLLADHYDVHRYRVYQQNPHLQRFTPAFVALIRLLSAEVANIYVTTGEILLDVALLRSLADHVDDDTVRGALARINRDESRHIAIDFHMIGYYASDAYQAKVAVEPPQALIDQARAWIAMLRVLMVARPFLKGVFFEPMDHVDPSGARLREAFKRVQLIAQKRSVARRPFIRFMLGVQAVHNHPIVGKALGRLAARVAGVDSRVIARLFTDAEAAQAERATFDEMAQDTLAAKLA